MILRKRLRHTFPIRTFYITNVALLFGFASVLGDIYSLSRSKRSTPKDCQDELKRFSNSSSTDQGVWLTYTGNESDYAPYSLKYDDLKPDSNPHAPLAPRECDITVTTINGAYAHLSRYAVVKISWSTPSNVTGLEGYVAEVKFKAKDRKTETKVFTVHLTRAFVPNRNTPRYAPNKADYYDCLRLGPLRDDSVVRFSSLPHSYNNFVEAYIHYVDTGVNTSDFRNASNWATLMVVKSYPQETMAKVMFTAAPPELPFTQYIICHNFSSEIPNATVKVKPEEKQPERKFYNIEPGVYRVWLLAQRDNEEILECDTALTRVNRVAAVVNNIDMTRSVGIYKASSKSTVKSIVKQPEDNDGRTWIYVTGAAVVGLVALLLTAVLTVVRRKLFRVRTSSSSTSSSDVSGAPNENESASKEVIVQVFSGLDRDNFPGVTTITEIRKLFILYSSDNDPHRRVVHRFALFLERHCRCAVVLDTWCEQELAELSPIQWLLSQLRFVDTILVIHSEGGTRRFNASLEGHGFEKKAKDSGHLEDVFVPAVKLLINDQQGGTLPKTRRVFNAYFSYSKKKTGVIDAMRGQTYELMRNIEELILLIHGLSKSGKSGVSRVPVINYNEFSSVSEGKNLVKAIDAAERYHTHFPGWFDSIYMKSDCDTLQCSRETALANRVSSLTDLSNDNLSDIRQIDITQSDLEHRSDRNNDIYCPNNKINDVNYSGSLNDDDDDVDDDESGCPSWIKPDSMHDDMSSIDSLTQDYITREFNEDAESS